MRCRARVRARRLHPHDGTGVNRRPNGCRRPDLGKPHTGRDDDVADTVTNPHPLAHPGSDPHAVSDAVTDALAHAVAHAVADTQPLGRPPPTTRRPCRSAGRRESPARQQHRHPRTDGPM